MACQCSKMLCLDHCFKTLCGVVQRPHVFFKSTCFQLKWMTIFGIPRLNSDQFHRQQRFSSNCSSEMLLIEFELRVRIANNFCGRVATLKRAF